jgi:hypothetical protein
MCEACSTCEGEEIYIQDLLGKCEGRGYCEELRVDRRTTLILISRKVAEWIDLAQEKYSCQATGERSNEPSNYIKCGKFIEQRQDCFVELVI